MLIAPVIAAISSINGDDDDDGTFSEFPLQIPSHPSLG
jgi:hypothetical protein